MSYTDSMLLALMHPTVLAPAVVAYCLRGRLPFHFVWGAIALHVPAEAAWWAAFATGAAGRLETLIGLIVMGSPITAAWCGLIALVVHRLR